MDASLTSSKDLGSPPHARMHHRMSTNTIGVMVGLISMHGQILQLLQTDNMTYGQILHLLQTKDIKQGQILHLLQACYKES